MSSHLPVLPLSARANQPTCHSILPPPISVSSKVSARHFKRVLMVPRQDRRKTKIITEISGMEALETPPAHRTAQMVDAIFNILSKWPDFTGCIQNDDERRSICQKIELEEHHAQTILFCQGDDPDGWYLVYKGSCLVIIGWPDDSYNDGIGPDTIRTLRYQFGENANFRCLAIKKPTQEFGSTALIKEKPRNATIFVNEDSLLLRVDANNYRDSVAWYAQTLLERKASFLERVKDLSPFRECPECFLRLAENLREIHLKKGEIYSYDNPICKGFIVMQSGMISKHYKADFSKVKYIKNIQLMEGVNIEIPTDEEDVQTDIYCAKQVVPDPSLAIEGHKKFILVVVKDSVGYELMMSDLYYLVPFDIRERMIEAVLQDPDDKSLVNKWIDREKAMVWKAYKKRINKEARDFVKAEKRITNGTLISRVPKQPKAIKSPRKGYKLITYHVTD